MVLRIFMITTSCIMFFISKDKEGPELVTIPATTFYSCSGCKFYEYGMIKSGMHPIYRHNCNHSKGPAGVFDPGNLFNDHTPPWCPFLFAQTHPNVS